MGDIFGENVQNQLNNETWEKFSRLETLLEKRRYTEVTFWTQTSLHYLRIEFLHQNALSEILYIMQGNLVHQEHVNGVLNPYSTFW